MNVSDDLQQQRLEENQRRMDNFNQRMLKMIFIDLLLISTTSILLSHNGIPCYGRLNEALTLTTIAKLIISSAFLGIRIVIEKWTMGRIASSAFCIVTLAGFRIFVTFYETSWFCKYFAITQHHRILKAVTISDNHFLISKPNTSRQQFH
ncbi:unnamed protein product [Caenorhabditis brenneri]